MQVGGKLGIFTYHTSDVFTHYLKVNLMSQEPRLSRQESEMDEFEGGDLAGSGVLRAQAQSLMKQLGFGLIGRWYWVVLGLILGGLGAG